MSGGFGIGNQKSKMEFDLTMVSKLVKFFEFFAWENVLIFYRWLLTQPLKFWFNLQMKVADLKRELKLRGLTVTGKKEELVERLQVRLRPKRGVYISKNVFIICVIRSSILTMQICLH